MCDGIIAVSYKDKDYIFIIEVKTACINNYKKQLINGKLFCDWLIALFTEHRYIKEQPIYIALLVWQPKSSSNKPKTIHNSAKSSDEPLKLGDSLKPHFKKFFEIQNQKEIFLQEYLKYLKGS